MDYGIIVSKYSILQLFHVYAIMVDTSVLQYYMGETDIERWIVRDSWKVCFNAWTAYDTNPPFFPPFPTFFLNLL